MAFTIENSAGDILGDGKSESAAIERALEMLRDDPELGELIVMEWREVATVTHGPGPDWGGEIVVLRPGEKIKAPASFRCNPDESAGLKELENEVYGDVGYDVSDPKHPEFHSVHVDIWDARDRT